MAREDDSALQELSNHCRRLYELCRPSLELFGRTKRSKTKLPARSAANYIVNAT